MTITIGVGHNTVSLTDGEVREVIQKSPDVMSLVLFAAQVGLQLRDSYNLAIDTLPQPWTFAYIHDCWADGRAVHDAAFMLCNANARHEWDGWEDQRHQER